MSVSEEDESGPGPMSVSEEDESGPGPMSVSEEDESGPGPMSALDPAIAKRLKRNADGLFAAVAQERGTGAVLMVAWMDDEALARTLASREATYFSRSRGRYWVKGETSGHTQYVHSVRLDCDGDTVLLEVDQQGAACHTGEHTCFEADVLLRADEVCAPDPGGRPGDSLAGDGDAVPQAAEEK